MSDILGMFYLDLSDADGNPLSITSSLEMGIPSNVMNDDDVADISLYSMNEQTGIWEFESSIEVLTPARRRRKRHNFGSWGANIAQTVEIQGLKASRQLRNFDRRLRDTCQSKLRTYTDNTYTEDFQDSNIRVEIILHGTPNYFINYVYLGSNGGYCMPHPCISGVRGSISVRDADIYLIPAASDDANNGVTPYVTTLEYSIPENTTRIDTDLDINAVSTKGPFYRIDKKWTSSKACQAAPISDFHFKFGRTTYSSAFYEFHPVDQYFNDTHIFPDKDTANCTDLNFLQWYPWDMYRNKKIQAFFLKVGVPNTGRAYRIQATSYINNTDHPYNGQKYGLRQITIDTTVTTAGCIEIRRPNLIKKCDTGNDISIDETYTTLKVKVISHSLTVQTVNIVRGYTQYKTSADKRELLVDLHTRDTYGRTNGIFEGPYDSSRDKAVQLTINRCRRSDDTDGSPIEENDTVADSFGVVFG